MRIGEVAERAGVNVETLRYYERRGLLPEPARSPAGHRAYDDETVRFVRAIKEAQGLGFTLAEIEELLRLGRRSGGTPPPAAMRVRLAAKIEEVDAKVARLRRVCEDLARVLGCACDSLDHCTCGAAYLARRGRDPEPGALLHVTNGESAGNTLRQTGLGGAVLSWQDVLHEGPVPALPRPRLRETRARFLSDCGWGSRRSILAGLERRDRLVAEAPHAVLWFEHDLYDQLQLLEALTVAADGAHLELIDAGCYLGPLTAEELESLWPLRRPVTGEVLELARAGWAAFTAPEPTALAAFLERDTSALPYLAPALRRLLEELPDDAGLSRSERQLLALLADGPRLPPQLFAEVQRLEEAPFEGDAWVWRRAASLVPLVEPVPQPPPLGDARRFAATPVTLTDAGRAVLAGAADAVELRGIDRWLGGTHLTPAALWRRGRDGEIRRAPAP